MPDDPTTTPGGTAAPPPPPAPLLGRSVAELEASRLFTASGARMRRMTGRDRLYVSEHNDYLVQVDDDRRVVALLATLVPPDEDRADECFGSSLRHGDAMLLQLAHEVLGLAPDAAAELAAHLYRDGYLPRTAGPARLSFVAGKRFHGGRALCLVAALPGQEAS